MRIGDIYNEVLDSNFLAKEYYELAKKYANPEEPAELLLIENKMSASPRYGFCIVN